EQDLEEHPEFEGIAVTLRDASPVFKPRPEQKAIRSCAEALGFITINTQVQLGSEAIATQHYNRMMKRISPPEGPATPHITTSDKDHSNAQYKDTPFMESDYVTPEAFRLMFKDVEEDVKACLPKTEGSEDTDSGITLEKAKGLTEVMRPYMYERHALMRDYSEVERYWDPLKLQVWQVTLKRLWVLMEDLSDCVDDVETLFRDFCAASEQGKDSTTCSEEVHRYVFLCDTPTTTGKDKQEPATKVMRISLPNTDEHVSQPLLEETGLYTDGGYVEVPESEVVETQRVRDTGKTFYWKFIPSDENCEEAKPLHAVLAGTALRSESNMTVLPSVVKIYKTVKDRSVVCLTRTGKEAPFEYTTTSQQSTLLYVASRDNTDDRARPYRRFFVEYKSSDTSSLMRTIVDKTNFLENVAVIKKVLCVLMESKANGEDGAPRRDYANPMESLTLALEKHPSLLYFASPDLIQAIFQTSNSNALKRFWSDKIPVKDNLWYSEARDTVMELLTASFFEDSSPRVTVLKQEHWESMKKIIHTVTKHNIKEIAVETSNEISTTQDLIRVAESSTVTFVLLRVSHDLSPEQIENLLAQATGGLRIVLINFPGLVSMIPSTTVMWMPPSVREDSDETDQLEFESDSIVQVVQGISSCAGLEFTDIGKVQEDRRTMVENVLEYARSRWDTVTSGVRLLEEWAGSEYDPEDMLRVVPEILAPGLPRRDFRDLIHGCNVKVELLDCRNRPFAQFKKMCGKGTAPIVLHNIRDRDANYDTWFEEAKKKNRRVIIYCKSSSVLIFGDHNLTSKILPIERPMDVQHPLPIHTHLMGFPAPIDKPVSEDPDMDAEPESILDVLGECWAVGEEEEAEDGDIESEGRNMLEDAVDDEGEAVLETPMLCVSDVGPFHFFIQDPVVRLFSDQDRVVMYLRSLGVTLRNYVPGRRTFGEPLQESLSMDHWDYQVSDSKAGGDEEGSEAPIPIPAVVFPHASISTLSFEKAMLQSVEKAQNMGWHRLATEGNTVSGQAMLRALSATPDKLLFMLSLNPSDIHGLTERMHSSPALVKALSRYFAFAWGHILPCLVGTRHRYVPVSDSPSDKEERNYDLKVFYSQRPKLFTAISTLFCSLQLACGRCGITDEDSGLVACSNLTDIAWEIASTRMSFNSSRDPAHAVSLFACDSETLLQHQSTFMRRFFQADRLREIAALSKHNTLRIGASVIKYAQANGAGPVGDVDDELVRFFTAVATKEHAEIPPNMQLTLAALACILAQAGSEHVERWWHTCQVHLLGQHHAGEGHPLLSATLRQLDLSTAAVAQLAQAVPLPDGWDSADPREQFFGKLSRAIHIASESRHVDCPATEEEDAFDPDMVAEVEAGVIDTEAETPVPEAPQEDDASVECVGADDVEVGIDGEVSAEEAPADQEEVLPPPVVEEEEEEEEENDSEDLVKRIKECAEDLFDYMVENNVQVTLTPKVPALTHLVIVHYGYDRVWDVMSIIRRVSLSNLLWQISHMESERPFPLQVFCWTHTPDKQLLLLPLTGNDARDTKDMRSEFIDNSSVKALLRRGVDRLGRGQYQDGILRASVHCQFLLEPYVLSPFMYNACAKQLGKTSLKWEVYSVGQEGHENDSHPWPPYSIMGCRRPLSQECIQRLVSQVRPGSLPALPSAFQMPVLDAGLTPQRVVENAHILNELMRLQKRNSGTIDYIITTIMCWFSFAGFTRAQMNRMAPHLKKFDLNKVNLKSLTGVPLAPFVNVYWQTADVELFTPNFLGQTAEMLNSVRLFFGQESQFLKDTDISEHGMDCLRDTCDVAAASITASFPTDAIERVERVGPIVSLFKTLETSCGRRTEYVTMAVNRFVQGLKDSQHKKEVFSCVWTLCAPTRDNGGRVLAKVMKAYKDCNYMVSQPTQNEIGWAVGALGDKFPEMAKLLSAVTLKDDGTRIAAGSEMELKLKRHMFNKPSVTPERCSFVFGSAFAPPKPHDDWVQRHTSAGSSNSGMGLPRLAGGRRQLVTGDDDDDETFKVPTLFHPSQIGVRSRHEGHAIRSLAQSVDMVDELFTKNKEFAPIFRCNGLLKATDVDRGMYSEVKILPGTDVLFTSHGVGRYLKGESERHQRHVFDSCTFSSEERENVGDEGSIVRVFIDNGEAYQFLKRVNAPFVLYGPNIMMRRTEHKGFLPCMTHRLPSMETAHIPLHQLLASWRLLGDICFPDQVQQLLHFIDFLAMAGFEYSRDDADATNPAYDVMTEDHETPPDFQAFLRQSQAIRQETWYGDFLQHERDFCGALLEVVQEYHNSTGLIGGGMNLDAAFSDHDRLKKFASGDNRYVKKAFRTFRLRAKAVINGPPDSLEVGTLSAILRICSGTPDGHTAGDSDKTSKQDSHIFRFAAPEFMAEVARVLKGVCERCTDTRDTLRLNEVIEEEGIDAGAVNTAYSQPPTTYPDDNEVFRGGDSNQFYDANERRCGTGTQSGSSLLPVSIFDGNTDCYYLSLQELKKEPIYSPSSGMELGFFVDRKILKEALRSLDEKEDDTVGFDSITGDFDWGDMSEGTTDTIDKFQIRSKLLTWVCDTLMTPLSAEKKQTLLGFLEKMDCQFHELDKVMSKEDDGSGRRHSGMSPADISPRIILHCLATEFPTETPQLSAFRTSLLSKAALNGPEITQFTTRKSGYGIYIVAPRVADMLRQHQITFTVVDASAQDGAGNNTDVIQKLYLDICRSFSHLCCFVYVKGRTTIDDSLLKWCAEFTKKTPWRYIFFESCNIAWNLPENRDRCNTEHADGFTSRTLADLKAAAGMRPLHKDKFAEFVETSTFGELQTQMGNGTVSNWDYAMGYDIDFQEKVDRFINNDEYRIMLLSSPPGAGKTYYVEDKLKKDQKGQTKRFDGSDDRLVFDSLDSILNGLVDTKAQNKQILIIDEYHMLMRQHKEALFNWLNRNDNVRGLLIANRLDADDDALVKEFMSKRKNSRGNEGSVAVDYAGECIRSESMISLARLGKVYNKEQNQDKGCWVRLQMWYIASRLLLGEDSISLRLVDALTQQLAVEKPDQDELTRILQEKMPTISPVTCETFVEVYCKAICERSFKFDMFLQSLLPNAGPFGLMMAMVAEMVYGQRYKSRRASGLDFTERIASFTDFGARQLKGTAKNSPEVRVAAYAVYLHNKVFPNGERDHDSTQLLFRNAFVHQVGVPYQLADLRMRGGDHYAFSWGDKHKFQDLAAIKKALEVGHSVDWENVREVWQNYQLNDAAAFAALLSATKDPKQCLSAVMPSNMRKLLGDADPQNSQNIARSLIVHQVYAKTVPQSIQLPLKFNEDDDNSTADIMPFAAWIVIKHSTNTPLVKELAENPMLVLLGLLWAARSGAQQFSAPKDHVLEADSMLRKHLMSSLQCILDGTIPCEDREATAAELFGNVHFSRFLLHEASLDSLAEARRIGVPDSLTLAFCRLLPRVSVSDMWPREQRHLYNCLEAPDKLASAGFFTAAECPWLWSFVSRVGFGGDPYGSSPYGTAEERNEFVSDLIVGLLLATGFADLPNELTDAILQTHVDLSRRVSPQLSKAAVSKLQGSRLRQTDVKIRIDATFVDEVVRQLSV
ncbi:hypothetical protein KIPB_001119, partial [Kipferlia bialata]